MQKLAFDIPARRIIDYTQNTAFLGSCFSAHLSSKMVESGFQVRSNPFGVIFNPISIADNLLLTDDHLRESVFMRNDVALSWLANSTVFAYDKEALKSQLVEKRNSFLHFLAKTHTLFITLGSAWVYEYKETGRLVANCHKTAGNKFNKRLLRVEEIVAKWELALTQLKTILPQGSEIVFTVSPVRHTKDGLIDNSRSKARLIEAVHQLCESKHGVSYFPAYEYVLDVLRDYNYFSQDGVHPNDACLQAVWEFFQTAYFTEETQSIYLEFKKLNQLFKHKSIHPQSEQAIAFRNERIAKWEAFVARNPIFKYFEIQKAADHE